jgi:hypothetical protein
MRGSTIVKIARVIVAAVARGTMTKTVFHNIVPMNDYTLNVLKSGH